MLWLIFLSLFLPAVHSVADAKQPSIADIFKSRAAEASESKPETYDWTDESDPEIFESSPPAKPQAREGLVKSSDF